MKNERFILQQLQRNNKVYSVCLKIFSVALAVFAIVLVITLFMGAGIAVTSCRPGHNGGDSTAVSCFQGSCTKIRQQPAMRSAEHLPIRTFSIPDGYSATTRSVRNNTIREPKKIMTAIIMFAFLAVLTGAIPPFFIWIGSLDDFETFNTGMLFVIILFSVITLFLIILILLYIRDYRVAKKLMKSGDMPI